MLVALVSQAPRAPKSWTVPVGQTPVDVAVAARSGHVFVADSAADTVTMLDARTGTTLATTEIDHTPVTLAVDEPDDRVFTLNACGSAVLGPHATCLAGASGASVLDLHSGRLLGSLNLDPGIATLAVDERADRVFVANDNTDRLIVIDARTWRLRDTVALGGVPRALAVDVRRRHLFVSVLNPFPGRSSVRLLDSRSGALLATWPVGQDVDALLCDTRTGRVLVASDSDTYLLDGRAGRTLRRIVGGGEPLAVDERAGRALIDGQGHLQLIATRDGAPRGPRRDLGALDGLSAAAVAVDATTGRFYVATDGALWILDDHSGRVARVLSLRAMPVALAVDAATHRLFLLTVSATMPPRPDHPPPLLRWVRQALPWLPLPAPPASSAGGGTLTVLDTTRL
jgi:DNA-binding beta-propeller fold protein YncE